MNITGYAVVGVDVTPLPETAEREKHLAEERLRRYTSACTVQPVNIATECRWTNCAPGQYLPGCGAGWITTDELHPEMLDGFCFGCGGPVVVIEGRGDAWALVSD